MERQFLFDPPDSTNDQLHPSAYLFLTVTHLVPSMLTAAFHEVLCDVLPPTLLAQMAISASHFQAALTPRALTLSNSRCCFFLLDNLSSHI